LLSAEERVVAQQVPADGRTARRDRNRDAVLDAVLDLFAEDALEPSAVQVAERSGVSLRSVYRYFEDTDELVRAAIERNLVRVGPLFDVDGLGDGPLDERVTRMVRSRLALYEQVGPLMRATLLHAGEHEILAERLATVRRLLREQVEEMFAPELSVRPARQRREVTAALDLLLGFESMEQLRKVQRLTRPETARVLTRSVGAVLATR
jgi:AcrR family transcriptional regulator